MSDLHAVTGAFGYSGRYIAQQLINAGQQVITLTNSANPTHLFNDKVTAYPFQFDDSESLVASLSGVSTLYNTYWVRFNHKTFNHHMAVENTKTLFKAAKQAGVQRIVHVSITNPTADSHLEYFSGKAELEQALIDSGVSYAILRPTVLFGKEDILINNIAWMLRRFPVFGVFGDGRYCLQPIYVDDLAQLAVEQGQQRENCIIQAIGPETFSYRELVKTVGTIIGCARPIFPMSPDLGYIMGSLIGRIVGDVTITRPEIEGLMANLLYVDAPPAGPTRLTTWASEHASTLGIRYANELARRK
jgi:NADH dehydrogenase